MKDLFILENGTIINLQYAKHITKDDVWYEIEQYGNIGITENDYENIIKLIKENK